MFVKSKHYAGYIIKARVNLGQYFDQPEADVYVVLREMTMNQKMSFQEAAKGGDGVATFRAFQEVLPKLVVDHNFYEDDDKPMQPAQVVEILMEREAVAMAVLEEYKAKVLDFQAGAPAPAKSGQ
jgi:hypothetical protein